MRTRLDKQSYFTATNLFYLYPFFYLGFSGKLAQGRHDTSETGDWRAEEGFRAKQQEEEEETVSKREWKWLVKQLQDWTAAICWLKLNVLSCNEIPLITSSFAFPSDEPPRLVWYFLYSNIHLTVSIATSSLTRYRRMRAWWKSYKILNKMVSDNSLIIYSVAVQAF